MNWIVDIVLSNREKINRVIASDSIEVIKAIARACSRVLVKKVKIAPSKEIAITNEIKAIMSPRI
jgi:hypothetical protein